MLLMQGTDSSITRTLLKYDEHTNLVALLQSTFVLVMFLVQVTDSSVTRILMKYQVHTNLVTLFQLAFALASSSIR